MQQPTHPLAPPPSIAGTNVTTEQIQRYLDENKQLILAIMENQNLGKLAECSQYQALLQKNLLFLAAIADAQPQVSTARPPMMPHAAMQQGSQYMQQSPNFGLRPFNPQQGQEQQHQLHVQPQMMPFPGGHMGMRPGLMRPMHVEASHGRNSDLQPGPSTSELPRGGGGTTSGSLDGRGSKQDVEGESAAAADGHRSSSTGHGSGDAE